MNDVIPVLKEVWTRDEAVGKRLRALEPRIFGIPIAKFHLVDDEKVYIPYYKVTFSYQIEIVSRLTKKIDIVKKEESIIVDSAEGRSYMLDYHQPLPFVMEKSSKLADMLIPPGFEEERAVEKAYEYLRWKVIGKVFREAPDIQFEKCEMFYRPMWKMQLYVWGKQVVKMAPADDFATNKASLKNIKST